MFFIDIYKMAFQLWKQRLGDFLLPAIEMYLISLVVGTVLRVLIMVVSFAFFFFSPIALTEVTLVLYLMGWILLNGILMVPLYALEFGGITKTYYGVMNGEKSTFFSVTKNGFRMYGTHFALAAFEIFWSFVYLSLVYVPILCIVLFVNLWYVKVILLVLCIIFDLVLLLFTGFFYVVVRMPYVAAAHGDKGFGEAVSDAVPLVFRNFPRMLMVGLVFAVVFVVCSLIPMVNIIAAVLGFPFFFTLLDLSYRKLKDLPPFAPPTGGDEVMMQLYFYGTCQSGPPVYGGAKPPEVIYKGG